MSTHRDVMKVKAALADRPDKLVRAFALKCAGKIIKRTPVDTGRARGNWNVSVGEADGSTNDAAKDKTGVKTIMSARGALRGAVYGDDVWIANGLPYIGRLEKGWSKQAPGGMVRLVAAELQPLAERIIREIERSG
jgi:hypothetical protein